MAEQLQPAGIVSAGAPTRARDWRLHLLGLFLIVAGAHLWLVQNYTNPLPFWDQWAGEGALLILPWLKGQLTWAALFAPHNEHRIFVSRLVALSLFQLNGQWDAQLEMAVNALICGVIAVLIAQAIGHAFGTRFRPAALVLAAFIFVPPFAWENTLAGFQAAFYFLLIFSLAAMWGLGSCRPFSGAWWAGLASLVLACLSLASGFMAAVAVLAIGVVRAVKERVSPTAGVASTWLWCLAIAAIGWRTRTEVPAHRVLMAKSAGAFLVALGRCLAWPAVDHPGLAPLFVLPIALLSLLYLFAPLSTWRAAGARGAWQVELVLTIACWWFAQAAAAAYARGGDGMPPASRYMELLALGCVLNFLAATILVRALRRPLWRRLGVASVLIWIALITAFLADLTSRSFSIDMPDRRQTLRIEEDNTRGYVATGDYETFLDHKAMLDIPFPVPMYLKQLLDDPVMRHILPADIRPPMDLRVSEADQPPAFVPNGVYPTTLPLSFTPTWGSFNSQGNAAQGTVHAQFLAAPALPYLQVRFAGYLHHPNLDFTLRDGRTHRAIDFHPPAPAGERWHTDYLPVPGRNLEIVATDHNPNFWFAFSAPVEVGRLSYWAGYLLRRGGVVFYSGVLLLVFLPILRWLELTSVSVDTGAPP